VQSTLAAGKPSYAYTGDLHAAATILRTEGLRGTALSTHSGRTGNPLLDQAANNACWAAAFGVVMGAYRAVSRLRRHGAQFWPLLGALFCIL
jgi:hypothetical protein